MLTVAVEALGHVFIVSFCTMLFVTDISTSEITIKTRRIKKFTQTHLDVVGYIVYISITVLAVHSSA